MAASHNLRSHDQDTSSYAALPGTTTTELVQHNMTAMKANLAPGREVTGCHPSRWIYELIHNDFTVCDMFERARYVKLINSYAWEHPHRLVINGNQSFSTTSMRILSSICLDCHFHFVFKMAWQEELADCMCNPSQSGWPVRDNAFPWHHLVWAGSDSEANIAADQGKYYPLLARENFFCSAPPCTFQLTLEVSEPRMPSTWVSLLSDHDAIRKQLEAAREREPARYEGATDDWANQAPLNLNTYLKNLLESAPEDMRSISKRNKRFSVLFGPPCFEIFRQLEFTEKIEEKDGMDEGLFAPSAPAPAGGPSGTTELGSYRGYIEDVRAEVQCLIHKAGQAAERPTYCTPVLHADLQCHEVPNVESNALVNVERYRVFGILPRQSRQIIVNAYKRQWELVPNRRRILVDNLMAIANDSGDEMLSDYAITQSSVFDSQTQRTDNNDDDGVVSQALSFLGLQPPNNYSASALLQAFRHKLARSPADAGSARSMLLLIAQGSTDDTFQTLLLLEADSKMSFETAKVVLGLSDLDESLQQAAEVTKKKVNASKNKEETEVYLDALDAVADETKSPSFKQIVSDLRRDNGIVASTGNDGVANNKPVDLALPVGLYNIGNTCYLNSLLQYLFTVKPVRDIVLNYEDFKLDLADESIEARRLGGNKMQMDRGEAVVAEAFAQELAVLFRNLQASTQASTRPSQRLANAVLLSTHTLLDASKQPSEIHVAPQPPPLPARPSTSPPAQPAEDVEMVTVSTNEVPDTLETASNSTSQTLVDQDEVHSDHSYEKVENAGDPDDNQTTVVEIHPSGDTQMAQDKLVEDNAAQQDETSPKALQTTADVDMTDADEPETVDQKVLTALEHQKRSSGTDQQDVEEVMGSIINRLQAAIRPSSVDQKTGIQLEKIMETFFVTTVNYTKKFDETEYQHEISFDRSITAFPAAEGPCSLYDALGRNFDQQILEESKLSRYTAIKTLPPVLHVLIQRSQSMGSKNGNPVVIPETLYLDRYMDAAHDSPVFRRRVQDWTVADRIADLKVMLSNIDYNPGYLTFLETNGRNTQEPLNSGNSSSTDDSIEPIHTPDENWDFDGPVEEDFLLITPSNEAELGTPPAPPSPASVRATNDVMKEMIGDELDLREHELGRHFESMKEIPYRLHAVICHRGHLTSGHYWVWIHDFEDNVWRWYNDSDVKENKDTADVLKTLSESGEPYYLCYVRDEDKDDYVNVPKRDRPEEVKEEAAEEVSPTDIDGDVAVVDKEPSPSEEDSECEPCIEAKPF